jgi:parallel beta-helix repeat protein
MSDVVIRRNLISLTKAAEGMNPPVISGIDVPNGNTFVYGFDQANNAPIYRLQILQNDIRAEAGSGSVKTAGVLLHSLHECRITNNSISGMSYAGLVFQGSKWGTDSLLISNNRFDAFTENPDRAAVGGYVVITDSYAQQVAGALGIKRVSLKNNQLPNQQNTLARNNFFGVFAALPKRFLREIRTDNSMGNPSAIRIVSTD